MSTIVTRAGKGSALTHNEVDANFVNLNTDKLQSGNTAAALTITSATINGGTITGTALNGTLGATTPSTVVATTVVASSTIKGATTIAVGNATPSASGAGITFPATQSASTDANTLDDYEEGTWTPVFQGTGGSIGSTAYSSRTGTYTKIGNVVVIGFSVVLSNKGSWSGDTLLSGLPFTPASNGIQNVNSVWVDNVTFSTQINSRIPPNEALVVFRISTSGAAGSYLQVTGCTNSSAFYGIAVYQV